MALCHVTVGSMFVLLTLALSLFCTCFVTHIFSEEKKNVLSLSAMYGNLVFVF